MSLLTIVQSAAGRLGLQVPSIVVGSTDVTTVQFLALANEEGKELSRRASWQRLVKEKTFLATATETQTGALATDFDRMLPDTFFNRTVQRKVIGPLSVQEWQVQKSIIATVLFDAFRIRGNDILMLPIPDLNDQYAYEYVSNLWVDTNADGAGDSAVWVADTDTSVLDEELITLGIIWRFLKAKGMDYSMHLQAYDNQVSQAISRDGARTTVALAQGALLGQPRTPDIPEGSWNV